MTNPVDAAREAVTVVGEVLRIAGDSPKVRAAGGELGSTALTVTKAINNALLPLAAVNFAFDKAREYFSTRFSGELADKVKNVPDDQVVEPKASVAGPALQALAFSHDEDELRALYLSLLASAMDARVATDVHPAFVEIIRQLTAEEAKLLRTVLRIPVSVPVAEIRATTSPGWNLLLRHLLSFGNPRTGAPLENPRIPSIVENWIRLGLVAVEYDRHLLADGAYEWVEARPEVIRFRKEYDSAGPRVTVTKGILTPTSLGRQFAAVVGILDDAAAP